MCRPVNKHLILTFVAADKTDLVAGGYDGAGVLDQRAAFDQIGDVFDPEHGARCALPVTDGQSRQIVRWKTFWIM